MEAMVNMKYSLIAFKPEKIYWCGDDKEVHPALLIKENDLSREEIIQKIFELSKKPEFLKNGSILYSDCPYEEFYIFDYLEDENIDVKFDMLTEGLKLASEFNKEEEIKRKERWNKEKEEKDKKELENKKAEYEKLKLLFGEKNV